VNDINYCRVGPRTIPWFEGWHDGIPHRGMLTLTCVTVDRSESVACVGNTSFEIEIIRRTGSVQTDHGNENE